jgi:hypothetical protein
VPINATMLSVFNTDLDDKWYTDRIDTFRSVEALKAAPDSLAIKTRYYKVNDNFYKHNGTDWVIDNNISS